MSEIRLSPEELVAGLAERARLTPEEVRRFLQAQAELASEHARTDYQVAVPGIGVLQLTDRPARSMVMQFGPKKGQTVEFPAKKVLKFRVCKTMIDVVFGNPKSMPDLFKPEDEYSWYWYPPDGEPED